MKLLLSSAFLVSWARNQVVAFTPSSGPTNRLDRHRLFVSIGLGPEKETGEEETKDLVAGLDYEVPDHESFRTSRRSKFDEQCDEWFGSLLGKEDDHGILSSLAEKMRTVLTTPVPLVNEEKLPLDHEEWTPYVNTKLPWTPLVPAFGLEQYGLPVPRRNAETWRNFDVAGLVAEDYFGSPDGVGKALDMSDEEAKDIQAKLIEKGGWLSDMECQARLVYINGRFAPQLSKSNELAKNLDSLDSVSDEIVSYLGRLTDGFTDELAAPVPSGDEFLTSYKKLSGPDHALGEPTSQFAINSQQGTACFAALNTIRTGAVAYIHVPEGTDKEGQPKPILVVNAVTADGGAGASKGGGVACHPRCLVIAEKDSRLSVVQSCVDLDADGEARPKLYNGYTQFFIKANTNVTHSYLEESGGIVTSGVEKKDDDVEKGITLPREVESQRPALKDTHFEAIDVHVIGNDGAYEGTVMSVGGSGRVRVAHSISLLRPGAHGKINGFSLSGGAQRTDTKTNIHHVAQATSSEQIQKNLIGGRATGAFRGRIRVEQSAQQTDSQQISRTVLLSDKSRAWAIPSLEIIADDVQCTHGATVADLSEEELFYLRSRGLDRTLARNLLMYAFAGDVCECVEPAMIKSVDCEVGLQKRLIERLENLVPQGDRAIMGEFQSI